MLPFILGGVLSAILNLSGIKPQETSPEKRTETVEEQLENRHRRKLTPVSREDLWSMLAESHYNVRGKRPTNDLLVGAWAHVMLENAHGKKVWNNNIGNVGRLPSEPPAEYYSHFGKARYRSFDNAVTGAEAYWNMLYRCPMAIKYFESRNAVAAGLSLKRCNYYRSEQGAYSRILAALYERGSRISRTRNYPR